MGASVKFGRYLSPECAVLVESCGDSFPLTLRPHRGPFNYPGSIWIRRWGGTEISRWLRGRKGRLGC